jgi:hypothetical protein
MDTLKIASDNPRPRTRFSDNRPSDRGQRNKENSLRDKNLGEIDSSGRRVGKTAAGLPKRNLRSVQPEVANPRRAHQTTDTRADSSRELHRRRKQVRRLDEPARRQKQTRRMPKAKTP